MRVLPPGELQLLLRAARCLVRSDSAALPACLHGPSAWDPTRCDAGSNASTSYTTSHDTKAATVCQQHRSFAKAAAGASKAAAAAPAPPKPPKPPPDTKLASPLALLKQRAQHDVKPASLLNEEERQAAQDLLPARQAPEGEQQAPEELQSFKQIGLPLSGTDTLRLMHQSMSRAAGEEVQLRPFVFSSVFQSATAVAQYVANALEAGSAWPRVERFFLSSVEEDKSIAAIRVQVKGRLGRKASMAGRKVWEQGSLNLGELSQPIDFGMAQAMTRMGVLGIKVWIRYKPQAAAPALMPRAPPSASMSMIDILSAPRTPLTHCASAWWSASGPAQPLGHRTWRSMAPNYSPTTTPVGEYLEAAKPLLFRSVSILKSCSSIWKDDKERKAYLQSRGTSGSGSEVGSDAVAVPSN